MTELKKSEKRRRQKMLTLRLTEEEMDELQQTAHSRKQSMSALVRQRALTPDKPTLRVQNGHPDGIWAAIEEVDFRWSRYIRSRTPLQQADALTELANAWSDLRSWHPKTDINGMLPWERTDA